MNESMRNRSRRIYLKITCLVRCPSTINQKFGLISNGSIHDETIDMKIGVPPFFD